VSDVALTLSREDSDARSARRLPESILAQVTWSAWGSSNTERREGLRPPVRSAGRFITSGDRQRGERTHSGRCIPGRGVPRCRQELRSRRSRNLAAASRWSRAGPATRQDNSAHNSAGRLRAIRVPPLLDRLRPYCSTEDPCRQPYPSPRHRRSRQRTDRHDPLRLPVRGLGL